METTGGIGQQAEKFMTQVCDAVQDTVPIIGFIRKVIAMHWQRGQGVWQALTASALSTVLDEEIDSMLEQLLIA